MRVTLLIATYNWVRALELSLQSVLRQTVMPDEVIIADDGSTAETKALICRYQSQFPCPLIHVWHEDQGFRLAAIRNKSMAVASGDYLLQIDGDIILHPHFVEDHVRASAAGYFVVGSRVVITPERTRLLLDGTSTKKISLTAFSHILNALRVSWLSPVFYALKEDNFLFGRGCHMAFWKSDIVAVNGYDESFVGYGREDTDLIYRLMKHGVRKRTVKLSAIEYHLFHPQKAFDSHNEQAFVSQLSQKPVFCTHGMAAYL